MRVKKDKDTRTPGKSEAMLSADTADNALTLRQLQRIQERRMYLTQQQYIRENEELRNNSGRNHAHSRTVLARILSNAHQSGAAQQQHPPQSVPSSFGTSTSSQDNFYRTTLHQPVQEMAATSFNGVSSTSSVTLGNQGTRNTDQRSINLRQELLMEVLSQFEKKVNAAQQSKSFEYCKRQLNSNNGVAFDWGKLPRIGSVHSVQGIVENPPSSTQNILSVQTKDSSTESKSRMGKIEMSKLARLILNGAFDYFLNPNPSENQAVDSDNSNSTTINSTDQRNEIGSNHVPESTNHVYDHRQSVGGSGPSKDDHAYLDDRQLGIIAKQLISSFNQYTSQGNTNTPTTLYPPSNNAHVPTMATNRSYLQPNQRTNYNMSSNHPNVVGMTRAQTSDVYRQNPVRTAPRTVNSVLWVPRTDNRYIAPSSTSPLTSSNQPTGSHVDGNYRTFYPRYGSSEVRTARVEPISSSAHTPSPRVTSLPSVTQTSSTTEQHDANGCFDCLLLGCCPLQKAIMEAESVSEKEKDLNDLMEEEPELIITKVTTKDAERGPIERIDVDEWVASSENFETTVQVKQESVDKEDEVICLEEKDHSVNKTVNQMRLMAGNVLNEDNPSGSQTLDRTKQNPIDGNSDISSIEEFISDNITSDRQTARASPIQDSVSDNNNVTDRQTGSEVTTAGPIQDFVSDNGVTDRETASEVTTASSIEDSVNDNSITDRQTASEITTASPIQDIVTYNSVKESQAASEITTTSSIRDCLSDNSAADKQTVSEFICETSVEDCINDTTNRQNVSEAIDADSIQDCNSNNLFFNGDNDDDITKDTDFPSSSVSSPETVVNNNDTLTNFGTDDDKELLSSDDQTDGDTNQNESSGIPVDNERNNLTLLINKINKLEHYLTSLKRRMNERNQEMSNEEGESGSGLTNENEYDKGDRNYEKYLSIETGDCTENESNKNVDEMMENVSDCESTCRRMESRKEMSLQDVKVLNKLEKALEENQEKLRHQNVLWIRKNILKARLIMLKKIERIRQKYGERLPEISTRPNKRSARETLDVRDSLLVKDVAKEATPKGTKGNCISPNVKLCVPLVKVVDNENTRKLESEVIDNHEMSNCTSEEPHLKYPYEQIHTDEETDLNEEKQNLISKFADEEAADKEFANQKAAGQEAIGSEDADQEFVDQGAFDLEAADQEFEDQEDVDLESANQEFADQEFDGQEAADTNDVEVLLNYVENSVESDKTTGFDNAKAEEEQHSEKAFEETDPVNSFVEHSEKAFEETDPVNSFVDNVVIIKSEGVQRLNANEGTFTLEDAIKKLVEISQDQQNENQDSCSSSPDESQTNPFETSLADALISDESQKNTAEELANEGLLTTNDQRFESMRISACEAQPNQILESRENREERDEIPKNIFEDDSLSENHFPEILSPVLDHSISYSVTTNQQNDSQPLLDKNSSTSNCEVEIRNISARKEKRRSEDQDEHVKTKKPRNDQKKEPKKTETSSNIWDTILKRNPFISFSPKS